MFAAGDRDVAIRLSLPKASARLSDLAVDLFTGAFGLWTLCCHVTVARGGNGRQLLWTAAVTAVGIAVLAVAAVVLRARGDQHGRAPGTTARAALAESTSSRADWIASAFGLVGASGLVWLFRATKDGWLLWSAALCFFAAASVHLLSRSSRFVIAPAPPRMAFEEVALWALAGLGALVTALMHLPNSDDVVYVSIAVALADHPELRLYAYDTIHNSSAHLLAAYCVHAFELLGGAISLVSGVPALLVIHVGLATLAGALTPLAWARLFRLLDPVRWLWLVAIVFSLYLFDGSDTRSISMHGFVRLFQGKAILLTVAVPLITAHGIALGCSPSWSAWWRLTATMIAAIGLSSTGLWLAPLVAGTALCVAFVPRVSWLKTLAWGLSSCVYPVCAALWVRAAMITPSNSTPLAAGEQRAGGLLAATVNVVQSGRASFGFISNAWRYTFGSPRIALAYAVCLVFAWPLARTELARRYIVVFCLVGIAFLLNPALVDFVRHNVTGTGIYGRVLWFLPIPAAFALCFASLVPQTASLRLKALASVAVLAGLFAFFHFVPKLTALRAGKVEWSLRPKVYAEPYQVAEYFTRALPRDSYVLTPWLVSLELPLLQHHPYPILTKPPLLRQDGALRNQLRSVISKRGEPVDGARRARFLAGLDKLKVAGIAVKRGASGTPGLEPALMSAGFSLVRVFPHHIVWTRVVATGAPDATRTPSH